MSLEKSQTKEMPLDTAPDGIGLDVPHLDVASYVTSTGDVDNEPPKSSATSENTELSQLKKQVLDLSSSLTDKDLKFHRLSQRLNDFENDAQRQRRLNESLANELEELKAEMGAKTKEHETEKKRLQDEREWELTEFLKQVGQMSQKIKTLSERNQIKEDIVIPGLLEQLEEKGTLLERAEENLASTVTNMDKFRADLAVLAEERDALTKELQNYIRDTGHSSNEISEVLALRDSMATEYATYKNNNENTSRNLKECVRQKDELIEQLIRRIDCMNKPAAATLLPEKDASSKCKNDAIIWVRDRLGKSWKTKLLISAGVLSVVGTSFTVSRLTLNTLASHCS